MTPNGRYARAQRAMVSAPAHELVEALLAALVTSYGVTGGDLLLADYRLTTLRPLLGDRPVSLDGSTAGEVYVSQRVTVGRYETELSMHLPVSARGDRLGVLVLTVAEQPDPATQQELADLAAGLAHELRAVDGLTDRYRTARRSEPLTLAAEMQWELLPARSVVRDEFALAGQLEPAYAVRGDNFDWSSGTHYLNLAVTNGMGEGIRAAMLTNLAVQALRNARMSGGRLVDQASLADQALYAEHGGSQYLSTLLMRFELATGRVTVIDAGSPWLLRVRDDHIERVPLDAQLPLGMFDGTVYQEQEFAVHPGDRLFAISDGVHASSYGGQAYGGDPLGAQSRLLRAIAEVRHAPPAEAVRTILDDMQLFRERTELEDDAAVVCVDWTGKSG